MSVQLTDPATEIAELIEHLLKQPPSADPTWSVLQRVLAVTLAEYWQVSAILQDRLVRLRSFIDTLEDKEFDEGRRQRVQEAIGNFLRLFDLSRQNQAWQNALARDVGKDQSDQFRWFSIFARRYRPLRKLDDEDRKMLIAKIDDVLKSIPETADFPEWAKSPLIDGLHRLRFVLRHLLFLGHELAIDELFNLFQRTIILEDQSASERASKDSAARPATILSVLNVIALTVNLLCLPEQVDTAFEKYKGWYLSSIVENPRLPKPEQRLLPAPVAIEQQSENSANGNNKGD